jgi:hypothetical protein
MALTKARNYGGNIDGNSYTAQYDGAASAAKLTYTGNIQTTDGKTGPVFTLEADADGATRGQMQQTVDGRYSWILIDTSDGLVATQEPM